MEFVVCMLGWGLSRGGCLFLFFLFIRSVWIKDSGFFGFGGLVVGCCAGLGLVF